MNLEYIENSKRSVVVVAEGAEIGMITGGESGIDCRSKKFWDIATGIRKAPSPEWSYWLKDLRSEEYVNCEPLSSINQAKALAEYHFKK